MVHEEFIDPTQDPILLLPTNLRIIALNLWFAHKHLPGMETPAAIAFVVSKWLERKPTIGEKLASEAMEYAMSPHAMQGHKTTADVICSMARLVEESRQRPVYDF